MYNSVADAPERLAKIKNLTLFWSDLEEKKLPQWVGYDFATLSDMH